MATVRAVRACCRSRCGRSCGRSARTQHFAPSAGPCIVLARLESAMNYFRTAMLLAGLTALFMGVGYLIGGASGAMIALVVAAGMNVFTYWNSDRMVLSMNGAQEVDARTAPDLYNMVAELAARA